MSYAQIRNTHFNSAGRKMHLVHPGLLWIGHAFDIRIPQPIFDNGIRAVVDLAYEERPAILPRQLVYCRFPLVDGGGNEPALILAAVQATYDLIRLRIPTIVSCSAGMSRSPTIAATALAVQLSTSAEVIINRISKCKSLDLNGQFWNDVRSCCAQIRTSD